MEGLRSRHRLRPAIARRILRRRIPVLCRAFHADAELGLVPRPGAGQHWRDRDHDHGRLLHLVVKAAGQAGIENAEACAGPYRWSAGGI